MKQFSLPKSFLLTKPKDYSLTYKRGKRIQGDHFCLIFTPNNKKGNRLGISIHGQLKRVVRRNRIKRIIREFFRTHRTFLQQWASIGNDLQMMDIIFTVRKNFLCDSPAEVKQAVHSCLRGGASANLHQQEAACVNQLQS